MHGMLGEEFPSLLYTISAEAHFNYIHYLFMWMSCEHTTFSLIFVNMPTGRDWERKQRRLLWMSMNILRNFAGMNKLKDLWNEPLILIRINLIVLMTISSRHSVFLLCRKVFSKQWWLYSCLKSQKTIPGYIFNNNCYNIPFVHIRIVILNCHVTDGWLLKAKIVFY